MKMDCGPSPKAMKDMPSSKSKGNKSQDFKKGFMAKVLKKK